MPNNTPLKASAVVPGTADIVALVNAAGGDIVKARYDNGSGVLTIIGITQAALDDVIASIDPLFSTRFKIKQDALAELEKRTAAGMPFMGKIVQIDETSTSRMTATAVGMQMGVTSSVTWRMADNTGIVLDKPTMIGMAGAAMGYVLALRGRYWQIVDAAKAAEDEDALAAIDPLSGWPTPPTPPPVPQG